MTPLAPNTPLTVICLPGASCGCVLIARPSLSLLSDFYSGSCHPQVHGVLRVQRVQRQVDARAVGVLHMVAGVLRRRRELLPALRVEGRDLILRERVGAYERAVNLAGE